MSSSSRGCDLGICGLCVVVLRGSRCDDSAADSYTEPRTIVPVSFCACLFFFNDTATTEIYTLSLHDALPISEQRVRHAEIAFGVFEVDRVDLVRHGRGDRKSTRLNSSHVEISYAVFCLKKKKN